MIRVSVQRDRENRPVRVSIEGHALFADPGHDIVCAAVSMLVQTVIFALEDLLAIKPPLHMGEGFLQLSRPRQLGRQRAKYYLLVETMLLGLRETARTYPANLNYSEKKIRRSGINDKRVSVRQKHSTSLR